MTEQGQDIVLVTGASGRIGRLVVDELLGRGARVRALSRQPEPAALRDGVEIFAGDFNAPASLRPAADGADAVFLVWTAAAAAAPAVIEMLAARAPRVVYLSAPHKTSHPFFQQPNPMRELHVVVERLLAAAGLNASVIRPGMFASNALHWWAPEIRESNIVRWPYAAAETSPVDERDIAAVAARLLLDVRPAGGDHVLTGPESLSQAQQVQAIGDAIGRVIRFEELSPDEFRREAQGTWPDGVADMLLAAWQATLGHPALVTSAVHEILGVPPRTFQHWAVEHAAAFTQ